MKYVPTLLLLLACCAAPLHGAPVLRPQGEASAAVNYATLHSFKAFDDTGGPFGESPTSPLLAASDGYGYGLTCDGGRTGKGSLYRMSRNGAVRTVHSFKREDGECPQGRLLQASDGNIYGIASAGGAHSKGTVFKVDPTGQFTVLHAFAGGLNGERPTGGVIQAADGQLYGMADNSEGEMVYRLSLAGALTMVYQVDALVDGYFAVNGLVYAGDGYLYAQTLNAGAFGHGTVFRVSLGGEANVVHAFGAFPADSQSPRGALAVGQDNALYGTTEDGGALGAGTVFRVGYDGQYTIIHDFDASTTGTTDATPAVDDDGNVYVAARNGILRFALGATLDGYYVTPQPVGDSYLSIGPDRRLYGVGRSGGVDEAGRIFRMKEVGNP